MAEMLTEIDRIANDPAPPTFENTLAAMERAGKALERAHTIYGVYSSTMQSPEFQEVEREMEPKLAAFFDKIIQNEKLFRRLSAVYAARETSGLSAEQKRLVWLKCTEFARSGARLDPPAEKNLGTINQRFATRYTPTSPTVPDRQTTRR